MRLPILLQITIFLFAITVHEYAHGWMAYKNGDDTAKLAGRLTLNPIAHIDIFGMIIFPLMLIILKAPFIFGWAKPVPINPNNFYNPKLGLFKVGLSGPLANFFLAIVFAILFWILKFLNVKPTQFVILVISIIQFSVFINLLLGIFNLIPVPPLDGSNVILGLLPTTLMLKYKQLSPYGFLIIFFLFFTGILWRILMPIVGLFYSLLLGL